VNSAQPATPGEKVYTAFEAPIFSSVRKQMPAEVRNAILSAATREVVKNAGAAPAPLVHMVARHADI